MKVFATVFAFVVAAVAMAAASGYGGGSSGGSGGYGGGAQSIPAPPCPKNYLFSCQPNLAPAPCAPQSSSSYGSAGSAGAYSEHVPSYVNAPFGYVPYQGPQGVPY